jgi:indole-3-glycerol phosphate synthase / phosphoribosylanthranilate isomerase
MKGFLAEVYRQKLLELKEIPARDSLPEGQINNACRHQAAREQDQVRPTKPGPFEAALAKPGVHIIAEIKPASPTAGVMREKIDLDALVHSYQKHASAISVLTDRKYFRGSFELLAQVAGQTSLPVLCKDFIIETSQLQNAEKSGARAALLIVKMLEDRHLFELAGKTRELGMTPVFEVQSAGELARAEKCGAAVILINNRNLETLRLDLTTTRRLAPLAAPGTITISGSGIETAEDIRSLSPFASRFLIGSALMRSASPQNTLLQFKEAAGQTPAAARS